jgi:SAM-dependent methyltransferase
MGNSMTEVNTDDHVHYTDHLINWLELDFGEGFMSPGGADEVTKIVEGIDLSGKEVLDIGVGLAGPACVLVERLGAAHVVGIDVEDLVLKRAAQAIQSRGLSERVILKRVEPGPMPFEDEYFDVVFSKDAIIHIPDTAALFLDAHRVLKPGGWLAISDWYCGDIPFSEEMAAWVERLDIGLAMKPAKTDKKRLEAAGFVDVEVLDRTAWFIEDTQRLLEHLRASDLKDYIDALGEQDARDGIQFAEERMNLAIQEQLRPSHLRGRKIR